MAGASKAVIIAVGLSVAAAASTIAADSSRTGSPTEARLQAILTTLEEQRAQIERQQADIERQRAELAQQKAELLALKASMMSGSALASDASGAPSTAAAYASPAPAPRPTRAAQVAAKIDGIPIPRLAPRADQTVAAATAAVPTAARPAIAARTPPADASLVGRTAKNDLGVLAPGPLADPSGQRRTLKDLVRASIAPTLAGQSAADAKPGEVGERPSPESTSIDIAVLADRGGVLTPVGTLVVDPSVEYTHSSVNRFFFDGVEIVQAVLIGDFLAEDVDRDSVTGSLGLRYGLTKRLEVDGGVSWIYRGDRSSNKNLIPGTADFERELDGSGLGDVNMGVHYQLNKPKGLFPYFVANLRAKTDTGKGPFDVGRDLQTGLETELPSGSGFWSVEPSITLIYPSDPAVLFANIGYQWNLEKDVNTIILNRAVDSVAALAAAGTRKRTETLIGKVDPGDAISSSVGMGIGINDAVSLSFGYQHTWVLGTTTEQTQSVYTTPLVSCTPADPVDTTTCSVGGPETLDPSLSGHGFSTSNDAQIGELLMGASVNLNENVGLSFNVAAGLTSDAPDVRITFRMPLTFRLY